MPVQKEVKVADLRISNTRPFTLFAGPCVIESRDHVFKMAENLCELTAKLDIPFIFKASFDKANRTSLKGKRGVGMDEGLAIFSDIKAQFGCPVITDIHAPDQCSVVAEVADVLQIPAFLCRQTDLLVAAAKTGRAINVKKGQFLAPWDMKNVAEKLTESGNENIMLCERGASFGYNTLVSDMRSLPIMAQTGHPVVFDATHSVQQPGGQGSSSGGQREFVPVLARAALAVGVAAVFMETHDNPDEAFSDGPNMVPLDALQDILKVMKKFDQIAKENPVSI